MADEGKGGFAAAAGTALAAGGALVSTVSHSPVSTGLVSGVAIRTEGQIGSGAMSVADDVLTRSADDVAGGVGSSRQMGSLSEGVHSTRSIGVAADSTVRTFTHIRDRQITAAYNSIVDAARPRIVDRIVSASRPMTAAEVNGLLKSDLAAAAQKQATIRPAEIQFEVFRAVFDQSAS